MGVTSEATLSQRILQRDLVLATKFLGTLARSRRIRSLLESAGYTQAENDLGAELMTWVMGYRPRGVEAEPSRSGVWRPGPVTYEPPVDGDPEIHSAACALHRWLGDWHAVARGVIQREDDLARLGLTPWGAATAQPLRVAS